MTRMLVAMTSSRRQLVSGFWLSSWGMVSPRATKYSAIRANLGRCTVAGVVGHRAERRLGRGHRLRLGTLGTDLDLDRVLPVDLLESPLVELGGLPVERDASALERDDARAVAPREREEVQRADDGDAVLLVDLLEVLHHRMARRGIEARDRLVREHELGSLHERASDADTLLLPAGERIRTRERLVDDADTAEVLEDRAHIAARWPRRDGAPGRAIAKATGEDVAEDRGATHEVELLEDHPDPPSDAAQLRAARGGDVGAVEDDRPARGLDEPVDAAQERRLPGSGETDEDEELATLDVERDPIERARPRWIDLHELLEGEDRCHRAASRNSERRRSPGRLQRSDQSRIRSRSLRGRRRCG